MIYILRSHATLSVTMTCLSPLAADAPGQLDVLGHDGHALGMDGSQVGVLEETNQVGLSSLLEGQDGRGLEANLSHFETSEP